MILTMVGIHSVFCWLGLVPFMRMIPDNTLIILQMAQKAKSKFVEVGKGFCDDCKMLDGWFGKGTFDSFDRWAGCPPIVSKGGLFE